MITQEELKRHLEYNPETGVFTRKIQSAHCTPIDSIAGDKGANGYWRIGINGNRYLAHRLAWLYIYGVFPKVFIDHINMDKLDNRLSNLRECTNATNMLNTRLLKTNKSGHKNVSWSKDKLKWQVGLRVCGQPTFIGYFEDITLAIEAACAARSKYHGEYANHAA